jgi:tetratricopeptide (TPR) repeat protein
MTPSPFARLGRVGGQLVLLLSLVPAASAQTASEVLAPVDRRMALAEASLRAGEWQIAESRYRAAAFDAWMIAGSLHVAGGRLAEARDAFRHATHTVADADAAFRSLALVQVQIGEPSDAVAILTRLAVRSPDDMQTRRLLAQALAASGRADESVQTLEEAHAAAPDDAEVMFLLAAGYLREGRVDAARPLFAKLAAVRPVPQTWVLIGRTYRDFRRFDEARQALDQALAMDPSVRRAHYYLGTLALLSEGEMPLEAAVREFEAELKISPDDPLVNLRLGMALADARRDAAALTPLANAARLAPSAVAFHHLGRSQLAVGRATDAVRSLRRALELVAGDTDVRVRRIHYQLALALRAMGNETEAMPHFEAAKQESERQTDAQRERLARYLDEESDAPATAARVALESPLGGMSAAGRREAAAGVESRLARAYLNLGVMRAQSQAFEAAGEFLAQAASISPDFPQVQYSLGAARFNARQYDLAATALARALESDPQNTNARRMLALAQFHTGAFRQAADLLAEDPGRSGDASLQYTYGLALVRSDRPAEAEAVFRRMLSDHGERPELLVILGQAHAQQGDFDAAVASLENARRIDPAVADASTTLGLIHLKRGRLAESAAALRDELRTNPRHLQARHLLATVLDLSGESAEAETLLRGVLAEQPEFGDARYLLGKILLAAGAADQAVPQLEAAVRISPDHASYHYQLAQAYRSLGDMPGFERHLARFQALKNTARGKTP